jgi:hypothetical protein
VKLFGRKPSEAPLEDDGPGIVGAGAPAAAGTGPAGFGYKIAWLAIRTEDTGAAAAALGVTGARAVSWDEGVDAAYRARQGPQAAIFLTPAVDGWTLAVLGRGDPFEDDGAGGGALGLASLSRSFGETQKFATHRVVEYHEWQRWISGSPARHYCWIGESGRIRFDDGEPARAEGNLLRAADPDGDSRDARDLADEDTVVAVAAEWSVDPTTLQEREGPPSSGLLGFIA